MRYIRYIFVTLMIMTLTSGCQVVQTTSANPPIPMVVLVRSDDIYFPLAHEIAANEGAPLVMSWKEALSVSPEVILWVAAPDGLSDGKIIEAGQALNSQSMLPAIGLISGKTMNSARDLWHRGKDLRGDNRTSIPDIFIAANGVHPSAGTSEPILTILRPEQPSEVRRMNVISLKEALSQADYLSFTGHGGDSYLRIDPDTRLETGNLPDMRNIVAESSSCQTMRPWSGDSIALDFVEHGAAAYGGFAYSPLAGYMIGGLKVMPFRYSWPGFPIGTIAALQNRAAGQGFAGFPIFFLLGDPRITLLPDAPYTVDATPEKNGIREYTIRNAPAGIIPVRLPDAGSFRYVEILGVTDTADGDPFFNSRLQSASRNDDRFILFNHTGGNFKIILRENPPFYWWPARVLTASFDDLALFTPVNGGNGLIVICGLLAAGFAFVRRARLKKANLPVPGVLCPAITGGLCAVFLGIYQVSRLPVTTVNTKAMTFDPVWLAGVFLCAAGGDFIFLTSRKWYVKVLALSICTLPALLPGMVRLMIVGVTNLLITQKIGAPVYNYHMSVQLLIAAAVWFITLFIIRLQDGRLRLSNAGSSNIFKR